MSELSIMKVPGCTRTMIAHGLPFPPVQQQQSSRRQEPLRNLKMRSSLSRHSTPLLSGKQFRAIAVARSRASPPLPSSSPPSYVCRTSESRSWPTRSFSSTSALEDDHRSVATTSDAVSPDVGENVATVNPLNSKGKGNLAKLIRDSIKVSLLFTRPRPP